MKNKIALIISILALLISIKSCIRSDEVFKIQYTPRLSAQIPFGIKIANINDSDDGINFSVRVSNNSDTFTYRVALEILFSDNTGRETILYRQYYEKESLYPRTQWELITWPFLVISNFEEKYSTGKYKAKVKLLLRWRDAKNKEFKFVDLSELKYLYVDTKEKKVIFWFESKKALSTIDDKKELEKFWGLNFNY